MANKPIEIPSLEEAVAILTKIAEPNNQGAPIVLAIGGAVGSGKSTMASLLTEVVISTDSYLPDYAQTPHHLRDEPDSCDLDRLRLDLQSLKSEGSAEIPMWCFQSHRRIGFRPIVADGLIVCEGIFALHPRIAPVVDIRVMITADRAVRWSRWERIEQSGERGWGVERAREHFDKIADPSFERHAHLYEKDLDYLVRNSV